MIGPMGPTHKPVNVPRVDHATNQGSSEQARGDISHKSNNEGARCESPQDQLEQRWLQFGAETRPASRSISYSEAEQSRSLHGDVDPGRAKYFTDDAFDAFCKSLMETELDGDDSSETTALARPPSDVLFDSAVVDSADESDDIIVLDGPPADVSFKPVIKFEKGSDDVIMLEGSPPNVPGGRRTWTSQDEKRALSPCASPPAKRAKLTVAHKEPIPEGQELNEASRIPDNSVGASDGMVAVSFEESGRYRSMLPTHSEHTTPIRSQELQPRPDVVPLPGVATTTPSNLTSLP